MNAALSKLNELENNPPEVPLPSFTTIDKMYLIGCDTLGKDKAIPVSVLDEIDEKAKCFKAKFEEK